ncbi:MAG: DUF1624 domain-containing protein [Lachnospiraceae bacterium]|nr:DUF1624 domain-containing protein [Lachnospiraceae bacterium]
MISMVLYHACYDYFCAFGKDPLWVGTRSAFIWQQSICISFILVSGMVWKFGKKDAIKRGLILILLGFAITLVTIFIMPGEAIYYGILTFIGIATLFTILYDKAATLKPVNPKFGRNKSVPTELLHCIICLILFALTKHLPHGYIGTKYNTFITLPDGLYKFPALIPLGLPTPDFRSSDYFPVIPWIFMYFLGYRLGNILFKNETFIRIGEKRIPFLSWFGRKSLLVYIIHQPICFLLVWLICRK